MATRIRRRIASIAVAVSLAGCSLISTFDGLTDGDAGTVIVRDAGHDANVTLDSGVDAFVDAADANGCPPGTSYCGASTAGETTLALYQCDDKGQATVTECEYGCVVQTMAGGGSTSASCRPCFVGGLYCGGDKISGDKNTLYTCNDDGTATVKQVCVIGCRVNAAGKDDSCN